MKDSPLTSLFSFMIERVISANLAQKMFKKMKSGPIMVEVEKRHTDLLLKMSTFLTKNKNKGLPMSEIEHI